MQSLFKVMLMASVATATTTIPSFSKKAVFPQEFTDPTLVQEPNGQYWAFGSSTNVSNVPLAESVDFTTWALQPFDALPHAGAWAAPAPAVLSPSVKPANNGQYIMYYSAALANNTAIHCIGAATSNNIKGPYQPGKQPLVCPIASGGAGDPSAFYDPNDNSLYLVYKINGNSLVQGGLCGNQSPTKAARPTPIMIQKLDSTDGITAIGAPQVILQRGANEGPSIGQPSLSAAYNAKAPNGFAYFLFYSSGCYNSVKYDTRYATNLNGPMAGLYTKATKPIMRSGDGKDLHSPGAIDVSGDAQHVLFSSYEHAYAQGRRQLRTGLLQIQGLNVTI